MIEIKRDVNSKLYLIANYLSKHEKSSSADIAKGVGYRHLIPLEVGKICSRNPEIFTMIRINKGRNVYSLSEGVVFV